MSGTRAGARKGWETRRQNGTVPARAPSTAARSRSHSRPSSAAPVRPRAKTAAQLRAEMHRLDQQLAAMRQAGTRHTDAGERLNRRYQRVADAWLEASGEAEKGRQFRQRETEARERRAGATRPRGTRSASPARAAPRPAAVASLADLYAHEAAIIAQRERLAAQVGELTAQRRAAPRQERPAITRRITTLEGQFRALAPDLRAVRERIRQYRER